MLDQFDDDALYFQNSNKFQIHYDFACEHLSGPDHPLVPSLSEFNANQYYVGRSPLPARRGHALRRPGRLGARDRALRHRQRRDDHRSSTRRCKRHVVLRLEARLPSDLGGDRGGREEAACQRAHRDHGDDLCEDRLPAAQPRRRRSASSASSGRRSSRRRTSASATSSCSTRRPTTSRWSPGSITAGVPDAALAHQRARAQPRHAEHGPAQRLQRPGAARARGQVGPAHRGRLRVHDHARSPAPRPMPGGRRTGRRPGTVPAMDLTVDRPARHRRRRARERRGADAHGDPDRDHRVRRPRPPATPSCGTRPACRCRKAFAIPVFYYDQFMKQNGFYDRVNALRADPEFRDKPAVRDAALAQLRADMLAAPVDAGVPGAAQGEARDRLPRPDDALPHQHQRRGSRRLPVRRLLRLAHRRSRPTGASTSRPATPTATRTAACCRPSARPGRRSGSSAPTRSASTTASITPAVGMALLVAPQLPRTKRPTASR